MTFSITRTESLRAAVQAAVDSVDRLNRRVLFLCDIDNTLLKMPCHVGSDHWFRGQLKLIQDNASFVEGRIAVDIEHLRHILHLLYDVTATVPCEPTTADDVRRILELKGRCDLVLITARNEFMRDSTMRHLAEAVGLAGRKDYTLIMCGGGSKSACLLEHVGSSRLSEYDEIVFIDDCFRNVSDIVMGLRLQPNQRLTCFYVQIPGCMSEDMADSNQCGAACVCSENAHLKRMLSPLAGLLNSL